MSTTTEPVPDTPTPDPVAVVPSPDPESAATPDTARPPRRWHWIVRSLIVMALMLGNYVLYLPTLALVGPWFSQQNTAVQSIVYVLIALLVPATAIAFIALLMRFVDRRPLRETGLFLGQGSIPAFLIGAVPTAVIVLIAGFALNAAGLVRPAEPSQAQAWVKVIMVITMGLIVQGFPEELLWRGYLMQTLPWRNRWGVAAFSAALFGSMHVVSNGGQEDAVERYLLYPLAAMAFAFLAAALYQLTGQLWAAVGVHAGMHFATGYTEYIGLGSGPVRWLVEGACYVAIAVAVLIWIDRNHPEYPAAGRRLPA